nr:hypothetical protein [Tanacetum cinerariifolium]
MRRFKLGCNNEKTKWLILILILPSLCNVIRFPFATMKNNEESSTPLRDIIISELPSCIAITPVLSTKDSLIMGDGHLDTIPKKESDEFIKSSVENLVPNLSESENERKCDVPVCDNFTTFSNLLFDVDDDFFSSDDKSFFDEDISKEIYSNPLFDEEIISINIDSHHFNAESDLIESLLNQDSSIISSSKIDSLLDEFAGELIFLKSIPSRIDEADCDPEEEICLINKLLYDNSSPRPPEEINSKNFNAIIESFSPSPIPVEDSDPFMEEINLFLTSDGSIPPEIENQIPFDHSSINSQTSARFSIHASSGHDPGARCSDVKVTYLEALVVGNERDLTDLNAQLTSVKSQNDSLTDQVHKLEVSSAELQEKIIVYDNCMEKLEKFQDDRMKVVTDKLAKLDSDLAEMACPLGVAISCAIEKGTQNELAADIDHGREGMSLADVAAYNPDAEVDFNTALQELYEVDFPLLAELKSYKDASMEDIMNMLRLEGALADAPRMNDLQHDIEQLKVPIHKSDDQVGTSNVMPTTANTTTTLSTTLASASTIAPISIDDYEVMGTDDQAGADGNAKPFLNVDAELNIPQ